MLFTITYLNDGGWAFASETIEAENEAAAAQHAYRNHPMGCSTMYRVTPTD